jgi:hypothetical protein
LVRGVTVAQQQQQLQLVAVDDEMVATRIRYCLALQHDVSVSFLFTMDMGTKELPVIVAEGRR